MNADAAWDYGQVPPRSWSWYVEEDPGLGCPADKTVSLTRNGLSYVGNCYHPNWGGGYTIGSQTYDGFVNEGPLAEQMPEAMAAEIRAHVLEHRRAGGGAELMLVATIAGQGLLERVDCSLDGAYLTTVRPSEPCRGPHVFFEGAVAAGDHAFGAAFVVPGRARKLAYANDVALRIEAGQRLRVAFEVGDDGVEQTTSAEAFG